MLAPENQIMKGYPPTKLHQPFKTEEIGQAAKIMKIGSSPGCDDVNGEYLKYAPTEIHKYIADTLNRTFETGEPIEELQLGILTSLLKPGKKKGQPENIRPIILLSVIRKVLTICMIQHFWDRISDAIPTEQAAYQPGRGTTEHVFAVKMIAEKAITSNDYTAFLLLLDMSKAFDTVDRELLFNHLEKILEPDELPTDMSNFRQLADFRLFCLVLGHSCESSRSGLIFSSFLGGGGGVLVGLII